MSDKFDNFTMRYNVETDIDSEVKTILTSVYSSLKEKGYNPVNQIVGYLLSGDPTYITSHNNARNVIRKLERDELIEELLKNYLEDEIQKD
ncbi:IreB family regulatory phosphoprotein [Wukongibacter sp. M2B1]|uniref:IreB family regulatory phosphoprotein n=1 Tax=Wukongibacter sp. M2B1 TaxID=3088895 RepID=UPI003D7C062B